MYSIGSFHLSESNTLGFCVVIIRGNIVNFKCKSLIFCIENKDTAHRCMLNFHIVAPETADFCRLNQIVFGFSCNIFLRFACANELD